MKLQQILNRFGASGVTARARRWLTPSGIYLWVLSALMVASTTARADDLDVYTKANEIGGSAPMVAMVMDTSEDMLCSLLEANCKGAATPAPTLLNERSSGMKDALRAVMTSGAGSLRIGLLDYADVADAADDNGRVLHEAVQVGDVISTTTTVVGGFSGTVERAIVASKDDVSQAYNPNTGVVGSQLSAEATITFPKPGGDPEPLGDVVTGSWSWTAWGEAGLACCEKDAIADLIADPIYWQHPEWYGYGVFYYRHIGPDTTQTLNLDQTNGDMNPVLFVVDDTDPAVPVLLGYNDDRSLQWVCPEGYSETPAGLCKFKALLVPKILNVNTNSTVSLTGLVPGNYYKVIAATRSGNSGTFQVSMANGATGEFYASNQPTPAQYQFGGVHFTGLHIPYGATITSAKVVFNRSDDASGSVSLWTYYDCNASQVDLATTNIWNRWWCGGLSQTFSSGDMTPELDYTSALQTMVSSVGWCPGNAMTMFFYVDPWQVQSASIHTFDGDPALAPKLVVEYDPATGNPDACSATRTVTMKVAAMSEDVNQFADGQMDLKSSFMPKNAQATCPAGSTDVGCLRTRLQLHEDTRVGLRFTLAPIQPGATIKSAKLRLTAKNTVSAQPLEIRGIVSGGNAQAFFADAGHLDFLPLTSPVAWTWLPGTEWTTGAVYESPDIKSLVQQQIDQLGWQSESTLGFVLKGAVGSDTTMEACAWESGPGGGYASVDPALFGTCAAELVLEIDDNGLDIETTYRSSLVNKLMNIKKSGRQAMGGAYFKTAEYLAGYFNHMASDTIVDHGSVDSGSPVKPPLALGDSECSTNNIVFISDVNEGARYPANIATQVSEFATAVGDSISCNVSGSAANQSMLGCNTALADLLYSGFTPIGETSTAKVTTYTFNFNATAGGAGVDEGAVDLGTSDAGGGNLRKIAEAGGGAFKQAGSSAQLVKQLLAVLRSIADAGASVAAPGISVNALNRFEHLDQLYYSLFKPSTRVDWSGNLKRYQLKDSEVAGADGEVAVKVSSNGFFETDSRSFWSRGQDGATVVIGGAAEKTKEEERRIFTYLGDNAATEVVLTDMIDLSAPSSDPDYYLNLGIDRLSSFPTLNQIQIDALNTQIIEYLRATPHIDTTVLWPASIHNSPRIVTFNTQDASNPVITVFYGDNRGFIHAIDAGGLTDDDPAVNLQMSDETTTLGATAGKELFSFIPKELLRNAAVFHENSRLVTKNTVDEHVEPGSEVYGDDRVGYLYGMDGDITLYRVDADRNGDVEKVMIFAGMRRGGDNYYALDVSKARRDVDASERTPKLQWVIDGGTGDYTEMGETWSAMSPNRIAWKNADGYRNVLVFGGGHDPSRHDDLKYGIDDTKLATTPYGFVEPGSREKGSALFITDPYDGSLIWKSTLVTGADLDKPEYEALKEMRYSIVATPRLIDRNGDGKYDAIYVVDLAGQVFRFELNKLASGPSDLVSRVALIATLGAKGEAMNVDPAAQATAGSTADPVLDNRRFYDAPSIAYLGSDVLLALSSGYREEPTANTTVEAFFFIKDKGAFSASPPVNAPIVLSQLDNVSGNAVDDPASLVTPGWYFRFDQTIGEKGIGSPIIFNSALLWSTYLVEPTNNACVPDIGKSRLYLVDFLGRGLTSEVEGGPLERFRDIELPGLADTPQIIFREGGGIDVAVGVRITAGEDLCEVGVNCPLDTTAFGKLRRSRWFIVDED